jgi:hypothetical protein
MNEMTNQETDTALILENELRRRVNEVVERVVVNIVGKVIREHLDKYKAEMLMEVSLSVGKMLHVIEKEGRKPLWEATPEEFGLTKEDLNSHALGRFDTELNHAIRKQA